MKSRAGEVGLDRVAAQRGDVDLPAARRRHDAPGAELGGELEGVLAQLAGERLGDLAGIARDRQVEVGDLAAERRVAHRPAGDPDALSPAQRADRGGRERRGAEVVGEAHAGLRGTRGRDPAGDLVVDRVEAGGELLRADLLLALAPDQHRLRAGLHRGLGTEVDRQVVHRDRPHQGVAAAVDEDIAVVGEGAAHPVAIPERHDPHPGVLGRAPPAPVAGALPRREALHRGDVGAQREHRRQPVRGRVELEGIEAVDRDPAAGHVEVGALRAEDRGAVGGVDGDAGVLGVDRLGDRLEAGELLEEVALVAVGFVGGGEVGPDAGQFEVGVGGGGAGEPHHLLAVEGAEPAHAAVVLDVDAGGAPERAGAGGDELEEARRPDARPRSRHRARRRPRRR